MFYRVIVQPTSKRAAVRMVEVPDEDVKSCKSDGELLEHIFHNGQNDFQPRSCPSVSEGDLVLLNENWYYIGMVGFTKLTLHF